MKFLLLFTCCFYMVFSHAKTGYVDMNQAINKTKQGQRVKKRLEKDLSKAKKSIQSIELQLKKDRAKLEEELPLLTEKKRAEKIQRFQKKVLDSQKTVEAKRADLQKLEDKLMKPIVGRLKSVISQVASKEGYSVIENKNQDVLWVSDKLDLTRKVYTRFNKKHR